MRHLFTGVSQPWLEAGVEWVAGGQRPGWDVRAVSGYQMVKCKKQDAVSFLAGQLGSRRELCKPCKRIMLLAGLVIYRWYQFWQ